MRDFAWLTFRNDKIVARHRSPGDVRRTRASPAINAMTIDQSKRPTLQRISCPAANASTCEFHKVRLAKTGESGNRKLSSRLRTSHFLLRLTKLTIEKLRSCFVGANPALAAEEIVDFVGKHKFLKIDVLRV